MDQALYDHLGGRDAITAVVGGLYSRLLDDEEIAPAFAGIDMTRLRHHMTLFLSAVYAGRDMATAHAGLQITDEMFDRTVAHLVAVLESVHVAPELIAQGLATIAPLRSEIVHGAAV